MSKNNYTKLQKVSLHDGNDVAFSALNPVPITIVNFPADFPLPASQFDLLSKEATQQDVLANLTSLLNAFNTEDFASEATLAAFKTAFDNRDLATQATLSALLAAFNLEDFSSEATLELVRLLLASIDSKDFSTETTLNSFKTAFDNRDLATQTTLAALLSELQLKANLTQTQPVDIQNLPGDYPVPASQVADLKNVNIRDASGNPFSGSNPLITSSLSDIFSAEHDRLELTYVASGNGVGEIETITYKNNTVIVGVVTLGYDSENRIISVERS